MNDRIIEIIMPCIIHTENKYQTKTILEELYPSVLMKIYTGDVNDINDYILTKTVRVINSTTYEVDKELDNQLTEIVNFLERELLHYGINPSVQKLLETYRPIRASFLDSTGVVVTCQKQPENITRRLPLVVSTT